MNAYKTEIGSGFTFAPSPRHRRMLRAGHLSLSRVVFHVRALFRLAHRRPLLALGLAAGAGTAVSTIGAAASIEAIHLAHRAVNTAGIAPLAPAPAPPSAPIPPTIDHHHHLLKFPNPLRGLASWYGSVWNGRTTASGEAYDETKMTAAHNTLPLGTLVRVTNLTSQQSVIVRINDRGAMAANRVIDLSSGAAREIGLIGRGLARVKLEVLGKS